VGQGVSELRIHHGPGYRVYYFERDGELVVLLCGGDDRQDACKKDVRQEGRRKKEIISEEVRRSLILATRNRANGNGQSALVKT
jgi:phage-related protein